MRALRDALAREKSEADARAAADAVHAQLDRWALSQGYNSLGVLETWKERAAVREYDGGQERSEAERGATCDVMAMHTLGRLGSRVPR